MRHLEVMIQDIVQHVVFGLHLTELLYWHILAATDGVTKAPGIDISHTFTTFLAMLS